MTKNKFKKITLIGLKSLLPESLHQIESYADIVESTTEHPSTIESLVDFIGDSDAILISTHVNLPKEVFDKCDQLKYVGVYAKSLKCVDLSAAENKKVTVTNFKETSDWETAEFCLSVLLEVYRGLSPLKFSEIPTSIKNKTLGIIGFGKIGQNVAKMAASHGMKVIYFSQTQKKEFETENIKYQTHDELIAQSDIITLHGPPHKVVLSETDFHKMNKCKLLINTCLGGVVDKEGFNNWVEKEGHFAAFDEVAALGDDSLKFLKNLYLPPKPAWRTLEAIQKKDRQLLDNLKTYLGR